jgi:hypothetical protein
VLFSASRNSSSKSLKSPVMIIFSPTSE